MSNIVQPDASTPSRSAKLAPATASVTASVAINAVATGAERINYLILCNMAPELHAHVIPRFAREDPAKRRLGPFEAYDFGSSAKCEPDEAHCELLGRIRSEIEARLGAR